MENKIQLSKDEIIMGFVASCVENVTMGLIDTLKRWEDRGASDEQQRKVRNIIRWQRIGCIVVKISETLNVSLKEALDLFYKSETCRRFHDEESGLYLQGNLYVLNDFLAEISSSFIELCRSRSCCCSRRFCLQSRSCIL